MLPEEPDMIDDNANEEKPDEGSDVDPQREEPTCDPTEEEGEQDETSGMDTVSLLSMEVVDGPKATDAAGDVGGSGIVSFPAEEPSRGKAQRPATAADNTDTMLGTEAGDVTDASAVPGVDIESPVEGAVQMAPGSARMPVADAAADTAISGEAAADSSAGAAAVTIDRVQARLLVEAALFTAPGPLSAAKLAGVLAGMTAQDVRQTVEELNSVYRSGGHAFLVEEIAGGFRMLTRKDLGEPLGAFFARRSKDRLSRAALETLAIVAYKQPATRATIETIRGVASDSVIANLMELGLVRISGQAEAPGRPMLYSTTKKFLDHFGLKSLRELPREKDFDAMEKA